MIERSRITGLILAGGRATRMGSVDKGLQSLDGRPLVAHVLARLAPQVDAIVISANRQRASYAVFGHAVVADELDDAGPLAGVHAALAVCATDFMAVVPCDAPDLPIDLVARLTTPLEDDDVAVTSVVTDTRAHPIFCALRTTAAARLAAYLASGRRSIHGWIATMGGRAVSFADEDAFRNLNTMDDLHERGRRG